MKSDLLSLKRQAAERAVEFVESGMVVGLGHGTTSAFAVCKIARMLRAGELENILGIPCSLRVEEKARELGIPLTTLDRHPVIDLTIDGADEVDAQLNLIKGGGGAFLREKMVAQASKREIIVVDETKLSPALGSKQPVPVEVVRFGWEVQSAFLGSLGAQAKLRRESDGSPVKTDQNNLILDCTFGPISDPHRLARAMQARAGIVEHGLFLDLATDVLVATGQGVRHLKPERTT